MIVIPAIDLRNGKCVRLTEGRKDMATTYDANPFEIAERFAAAGAEWLHIVDLDAAFGDQSANRSIVRKIARRIKIPVQFGGGMRTVADVADMLDAGVARIVIGTIATEAPAMITELADRFQERVCVGIDARDGQVRTRGWERAETISVVDLAQKVAAAGIERIVYTDIARDGTLKGLNVAATCELARASGLRITAS
ncbi:MAG TPA: HisA/HisF-related TIM barrel protein, partial [Pyrinomonadaceae bacterium]|nr:HisA/HisF-related TIM barrel protein [Pyrinomonadaceae bacterium]